MYKNNLSLTTTAPPGCIGITEPRLKHILGVARKCYQIAEKEGHNENFCRKMFLVGWLHDVGYEFSKTNDEHAQIGSDLLYQCLNGCDEKSIHAISQHGNCPAENLTDELRILLLADMQTDSLGNDVGVLRRLQDIESRYGKHSKEYIKSCNIAYRLGLL